MSRRTPALAFVVGLLLVAAWLAPTRPGLDLLGGADGAGGELVRQVDQPALRTPSAAAPMWAVVVVAAIALLLLRPSGLVVSRSVVPRPIRSSPCGERAPPPTS